MNLQYDTYSKLNYFNIDPGDITQIRLQLEHEHITFDPVLGTILLTYVCSPAESPYYKIPDDMPLVKLTISQIETLLKTAAKYFNRIPFRKNYESTCLDGYSCSNYFFCSDINKNIYEYSSGYLNSNDEMPKKIFIELFKEFSQFYSYYNELNQISYIQNDDPNEINTSLFNKLYGDINANRLPKSNTTTIKNADNNRNYSPKAKELINASIPNNIKQWVNETLNAYLKDTVELFGICHRFWHAEAELYKYQGYTWYSPAAIHPDMNFD